MKRKITAILMTAALMLTMAACAGNSTADTGVESSASSAVSSKPVSNTSSTAASSAKPSASLFAHRRRLRLPPLPVLRQRSSLPQRRSQRVKPKAARQVKRARRLHRNRQQPQNRAAPILPTASLPAVRPDLRPHRLRSRQLHPPQLPQPSLRQLLPQRQRRFPLRRRSPKKRFGSWTYLPKKKSGIGKITTFGNAIGFINAMDVGRYLTLKTERQITILQNALMEITPAAVTP